MPSWLNAEAIDGRQYCTGVNTPVNSSRHLRARSAASASATGGHCRCRCHCPLNNWHRGCAKAKHAASGLRLSTANCQLQSTNLCLLSSSSLSSSIPSTLPPSRDPRISQPVAGVVAFAVDLAAALSISLDAATPLTPAANLCTICPVD